jgi:hypothetical protein
MPDPDAAFAIFSLSAQNVEFRMNGWHTLEFWFDEEHLAIAYRFPVFARTAQ